MKNYILTFWNPPGIPSSDVRLRNKILSFGSIPAQNCAFAKTHPTSTNTVYALFSTSNLRHSLVFIIKKNLTPTSWGAPRTLRAKFSREHEKISQKRAFPRECLNPFSKIFGAQMKNPARPKNFRARPGRPSARAENLRRDLKFLDAPLKILGRDLRFWECVLGLQNASWKF